MGPTRHFGAPVAGPTAIVGTSLGHTNPCVELNGHSTLNGATPPSTPHGKSAVNKFARALFVFATATALATVGCTGAKLYIGFSVNSRTAKSRACPSAYPNRGRASATPEDATALMRTSMHTDDPTLFLIPKHLFRQQMAVSNDIPAVGFGEARVRREGDDVTIVSWGNCMEQAFVASDALADEVSAEIIDLRSIQPWDKETILNSVEKTGRLVVVQEDGRSCSVGQMIISEIMGEPESCCYFVSAPQLVAKPDIHIGYNPVYEYAALPDTNQVIDAIRITMED